MRSHNESRIRVPGRIAVQIPPTPTPLPRDIVVPDLRAAAVAEADRLMAARQLIEGLTQTETHGAIHRPGATPQAADVLLRADRLTDAATEGELGFGAGAPSGARAAGACEWRPPITVFPRRGRPAHGYWAFRLEITDRDGQLLCERWLGLSAQITGALPRHAAALRRLLDPGDPALLETIAREHDRALGVVRATLEPWRLLGERREHALAAALEERHARISATLAQPGLFDRRAERLATAQQAVLDEALMRCVRHLERLARHRVICAGDATLVFGVVA